MDWNAAIENSREALKRVLAMLVGLAGLGEVASTSPLRGGRREASGGGCDATITPTRQSNDCRPPLKGEVEAKFTLPRHLHRFVLGLLRPAEAAARRLVIVAARGLAVTPAPARKPRPKFVATEPLLRRLGIAIVLPSADVAAAQRAAAMPAARPRRLALPLFDPLPRFGGRRRPAARGVPRIWAPGYGEPFPIAAPPSPGDPIDAKRLLLRFEALGRALDDLPREARRFALWAARRDAANAEISRDLEAAGVQIPIELYGAGARNSSRATAGAQNKKGPRRCRRTWPLRPGRPPGGRRHSRYEVHDILDAAHGLAILVLECPDTS